MAELVDALLSGSSAARRGGSSPLQGTILYFSRLIRFTHRCEGMRHLARRAVALAPRRSGSMPERNKAPPF